MTNEKKTVQKFYYRQEKTEIKRGPSGTNRGDRKEEMGYKVRVVDKLFHGLFRPILFEWDRPHRRRQL